MNLNKNTQEDTKPVSASNNRPANKESAVANLAALLNQCSKDDHDKGGDAQVAELLERLSEADGVAQGVEERLDGIIGNMDTLLAELQKGFAGELPAEVAISEKSDKPKSS